jgi:hypothetical protein
LLVVATALDLVKQCVFAYRHGVKTTSPARERSVLLSFRFATVAMIGSLAMALVVVFAPLEAQLGMLGALVSVLAGLVVSYVEQEEDRDRQRTELLTLLSVPVALSGDRELYSQYVGLGRSLSRLAMQSDPILKEIAVLKAASIGQEITSLADGTVVFTATETWRVIYEKLLASADVMKYRSVAWVRSPEYWQDAPGRQSMEANFEAVRRGVLIERIVILRDDLWPLKQLVPSGPIGSWIEEQHNHGFWMLLVRESSVAGEADLLADVGVYGQRAVGLQELDERSRTVRFLLKFDAETVHLANERWQRLELFATPYRRLLDQLDREH